MFSILDQDHDGEVTFLEFENIVDRLNEIALKSEDNAAAFAGSKSCGGATNAPNVELLDARLLWGLLDQDRSGSLSLNELAEGTRSADS